MPIHILDTNEQLTGGVSTRMNCGVETPLIPMEGVLENDPNLCLRCLEEHFELRKAKRRMRFTYAVRELPAADSGV